jgi:hypothetical protein
MPLYSQVRGRCFSCCALCPLSHSIRSATLHCEVSTWCCHIHCLPVCPLHRIASWALMSEPCYRPVCAARISSWLAMCSFCLGAWCALVVMWSLFECPQRTGGYTVQHSMRGFLQEAASQPLHLPNQNHCAMFVSSALNAKWCCGWFAGCRGRSCGADRVVPRHGWRCHGLRPALLGARSSTVQVCRSSSANLLCNSFTFHC